MIRLFDIADVNHSASSFNPEKLLWINQQHIIATPAEELGEALMPFLIRAGLDPTEGPDPVHVAEGYHERAETLLHMASSARYCYEDFEVFDEKSAKKHLRPVILEPLISVTQKLAGLGHWGQTTIHEAIEEVAKDYDISLGKLGQPIRVAVTSGPVSPPIDVTLWLVGQGRTVARLEKAIEYIEARAAG
jgi:glutamyl-tRNA synthetase